MILHWITQAWHWVGYMIWLRPQYAMYDRLHKECSHDGERTAYTELCVMCGAVVEPREIPAPATTSSNFTEYIMVKA